MPINPLDGAWWQRGVVYQVYPRSFQDSDGDGVGDLPGLIARLDYLAWLGVEAIWLSPVYSSPMADFGYDITDHCDIDPVFGTLEDFDWLVAAAHARGLKLIMDYVPNHTSDRHSWFVESRAARASAKRDWYIWRDAKAGGGPPTNWLSEFGGPAWEYDAATGQFYYHAYLKQQPDLNWRSSAVRAAMHDVLPFWLARGVDGFRIDTVHHVIKDDAFRDNPPNPEYDPGMPPHRALLRAYTTDRPEVHDVIAGLRRVVDEYADRVLIGEAWLPIERLVTYYGVELGGIHLPFNFHLIGAAWSAVALRDLIAAYEAALPPGAWPNWVLGNHDRSRIASRIGGGAARLAAVLLLTLRGTPTLYYGDELGLTDVPIPPEQVQDPWEKNVPGLGVGRDPVRTPMPWSPGVGAGFTASAPWLPLGADAPTRNVECQARDRHSMLSHYRRLIALRRAEPALSLGDYSTVDLGPDCLAYIRRRGADRLLVVLNFAAGGCAARLPTGADRGRLLFSSDPDRTGEAVAGALDLEPAEGVVIRLA